MLNRSSRATVILRATTHVANFTNSVRRAPYTVDMATPTDVYSQMVLSLRLDCNLGAVGCVCQSTTESHGRYFFDACHIFMYMLCHGIRGFRSSFLGAVSPGAYPLSGVTESYLRHTRRQTGFEPLNVLVRFRLRRDVTMRTMVWWNSANRRQMRGFEFNYDFVLKESGGPKFLRDLS